MKKHMLLLVLLILFGIFACIFFVIVANIYYPDIIVNPTSIVIDETTVTDTFIEIIGNITTVESLRVYKNYTYRIDQCSLYLTVYSGVDSSRKNSSFDVKIHGDFSEIKRLYIEGEEKQLLIWQK